MLFTMADVCSLPVPESGFQLGEGLAKSGSNSDSLKVNNDCLIENWLYAGKSDVNL